MRGVMKRINFLDLTATDSSRPIRDNVQDADTPELLLAPVSTTYGVGFTSTGTMMTRRFAIRLTTAQQIVHEKLFPVQWALFAAMSRIHRTNNKLGLAFVQKLTLVDDRTALTDLDGAQRGTKGWVSLITIDVAMQFTNDDLEIHRGT